MGILEAFNDPGLWAYALQQVGSINNPQLQAHNSRAYDQMLRDRQMRGQYGNLLDDMSSPVQPTGGAQDMRGGVSAQPITHGEGMITPQQRGILSMLPPEQGMGILAKQAFGGAERQIPGRDVPYSPEVLAQQMQLRGRGEGEGGPDIGPVTPRDYTPESISRFAQTGNYSDLQRYERYKNIGGRLYDMVEGMPVADVTGALREGKAAEAEGAVTGKYEGEKPILAREARQRVSSAAQKVANLDEVIDKAIDQSNSGWTTGFWGSMTGFVPGTPSHNLATTLETVQAIAGFQTLQEMRELSKTGGALGQVSNVEIGLLQNAIANVRQSQSKEQLQANLRRLRQQMKTSVRRLESAYKTEFGSSQNVPRETIPNEGGEPSVDDLINQYRSQ